MPVFYGNSVYSDHTQQQAAFDLDLLSLFISSPFTNGLSCRIKVCLFACVAVVRPRKT